MPERVTDNSFEEKILQMQNAALDISPVSGLTHRFYRYPARFSPMFAATAIEEFSTPGDLVLDPFVGGGTTLVEAMAHGRLGVGCDLNSLANFVARAKTTFLSEEQRTVMREWADYAVPQFTYRSRIDTEDVVCPERTRNLNGRSTRHLKKVIALALANLPVSAGPETERFARCAILRTAQWALDGRRKRPSASEFRAGIKEAIQEGVSGILNALSRIKYVLREDVNSLTYFPDVYGSGWHFHRFLGDWYGGAGRERLGDAELMKRLVEVHELQHPVRRREARRTATAHIDVSRGHAVAAGHLRDLGRIGARRQTDRARAALRPAARSAQVPQPRIRQLRALRRRDPHRRPRRLGLKKAVAHARLPYLALVDRSEEDGIMLVDGS